MPNDWRNTDSTNTFAKKMAEQGAAEGTLVLAEKQTAGRGRLGRIWISPPGAGIYASLILRPSISPAEAPGITLIAAVACAEALIALTDLPVKIKWPNDLLVRGKKITGIDEAESIEGVKVFHAGTKFDSEDILTAGGRVLGVTGWGADFSEARKRAYEAAGKINFDGAYYRKDIGNKALKYLISND